MKLGLIIERSREVSPKVSISQAETAAGDKDKMLTVTMASQRWLMMVLAANFWKLWRLVSRGCIGRKAVVHWKEHHINRNVWICIQLFSQDRKMGHLFYLIPTNAFLKGKNEEHICGRIQNRLSYRDHVNMGTCVVECNVTDAEWMSHWYFQISLRHKRNMLGKSNQC